MSFLLQIRFFRASRTTCKAVKSNAVKSKAVKSEAVNSEAVNSEAVKLKAFIPSNTNKGKHMKFSISQLLCLSLVNT